MEIGTRCENDSGAPLDEECDLEEELNTELAKLIAECMIEKYGFIPDFGAKEKASQSGSCDA